MDQHIVFDQVSHIYNEKTPFEVRALDQVSVSIPRGKVTAIIGHTGSGKSTLIQHLNALLRPTHGRMTIDGEIFTKDSKHTNLKQLRKKVSIVFQFPESQLFEETVLKDVMFGPINFGASPEEARQDAIEILRLVGIPDELFERSPFELSGGQMRRVAIAGVLACRPEVLVLDEPTAGLDPAGQKQMMDLFMQLQKDYQLTLILVTHKMEDVARYADHAIVMERGRVVKEGSPATLFESQQWLESKQLALPHAAEFYHQLLELSDRPAPTVYLPLTIEALADQIIKMKAMGTKEGDDTNEY